jgi:hypothetical protein
MGFMLYGYAINPSRYPIFFIPPPGGGPRYGWPLNKTAHLSLGIKIFISALLRGPHFF